MNTKKAANRSVHAYPKDAMKALIQKIFNATLQAVPECQCTLEVIRDRDGDFGFSFVVFNVDTKISAHGCEYLRVYGGLPNTSVESEAENILNVLSGKISVNQYAKAAQELKA